MKNRISPPQISPDHIAAIKDLLLINHDIIVGGSFALVYFGLLDRKIEDLDIFINKNVKFSTARFAGISDELEASDFTTDFAGEIIDRTAFSVKGIKVCCFKMPEEYLSYLKIKIQDVEIKIQNPCYAIAAKATFQKRNSKHKDDIDYIFEKLKAIQNEK